MDLIPDQCWHPAIEDDGLRDGAWVAEATGMIDLSLLAGGLAADPAQGTPAPRRAAHLHRRRRAPDHRVPHRHPPRRDPRARSPGWSCGTASTPGSRTASAQAKAPGLRNLPCRGREENSAWLEAVLTAVDLVCWTKLICFAHVPSLARCEIAAFRYRVLHVAARLTRSARQTRLTHRPHLAVGRPDRRRIPPATRRVRLTARHLPRFHRHRLAPACPPAAIPPARGTIPGPAAGVTWRVPARHHQPSTNPRSNKAPGRQLTSRVKEGG